MIQLILLWFRYPRIDEVYEILQAIGSFSELILRFVEVVLAAGTPNLD